MILYNNNEKKERKKEKVKAVNHSLCIIVRILINEEPETSGVYLTRNSEHIDAIILRIDINLQLFD